MQDKDIKILNRSYHFALRVLKMVRQLPAKNDVRIISNQLLRSATSFGRMSRRRSEHIQNQSLLIE